MSFVLKMDECQIVKNKRLERMSITLMNESLAYAKCEPSLLIDDTTQETSPTFSVQFEKELWWLGAFEVPKETNEVLAWVFDRIPWTTDIIKAQIQGKKLEVEGLGAFTVDWHLGGDLKTIKCVLGCEQGTNTINPCPFCMRMVRHKKTKGSKTSTPQNQGDDDTLNGDTHNWIGGVMSANMLAEPNRHLIDRNWRPIIPFELKNVHFCTLHAFMRIFDRLLKCHIDYAFTMQGKERQHAALQKVEDLLNSIDCHGGNVRIVTDKKASGLSYEIAQKVSMSGGKAKHFLERPEKTKNSAKPWELWKDLCNYTTFDCTEPGLVITREKVWSSFNKMVKLMNKAKTTSEERNCFKEVLREFTKAMVHAWGETNITHYMV